MAGKLKPLDVERETRPGKYPDGDGLYLVVASATSKNWNYRYWKEGKQRWLGLGSVKDVSLKDARLARDAARLQVKGDRAKPGVDIVQERRAARQEAKAVETKLILPTFEQCAETFIRDHWSTWSRKHRDQWPSSLKRYAYPTIGKLTIPEIKPSHIYELLRPIWVEKRETANRVRGRIETIIAKNVDVDDSDFRNPAELTKQLREKLPRRPKRVVRHHPALPYAEAPQFMADLSVAGGIAASMLRFLIFTASRRRSRSATRAVRPSSPIYGNSGIEYCIREANRLPFLTTKADFWFLRPAFPFGAWISGDPKRGIPTIWCRSCRC